MNFKEIIKDQLLNESKIEIPKGAKAAKIIFHEDLDGFFAALLTYNQLIKQGINPKNIKFGMGQYGKFGDSYLNQFNVNKGQMIAVVDFAELPKEGKPDFWTDHHVAKPDQLEKFKKGKSKGAIGQKQYGSDSMHIGVNYAKGITGDKTLKAINTIDSAKYKDLSDTFDMPDNFKEKDGMERMAIVVNSLLSQLIKNNPKMTFQLIKKSKPSLEDVYKNLLSMVDLNNEQAKAIRSINSKKPDWKMIDAIRAKLNPESAIDIKRKVKVKTDSFGKERVANLLVNQVEKELKKSKPNWNVIVKIANEMPKRIKTNLRNILKKIRPKLIELGKEIKNDYEYGQAIEPYKRQIRNLLLGQEEYKKTVGKEIMDIDFWRKKTENDLKRITTAGTKEKEVAEKLYNSFKRDLEDQKEVIKKVGNAIQKGEPKENKKSRQNAKEKMKLLRVYLDRTEKALRYLTPTITTKGNIAISDQQTGFHPSRFTTSIVLDPKTKERLAFTIRKFGMMIQTSANPSLSELDKKNIDLVSDMKDAFDYAKKIIEEKYGRGWGFNLAREKMGGHKSIANLANLHFISMSYEPKQDRELRKKLETIEKRSKAIRKTVGKKLSKKEIELAKKRGKKLQYNEKGEAFWLPKTSEKLKTQKDIQEKGKEVKNEFVDLLIKKLENTINTKYKDKKVPPTRIKPQLKEDIEKYSGIKKEPSIEALCKELLNS